MSNCARNASGIARSCTAVSTLSPLCFPFSPPPPPFVRTLKQENHVATLNTEQSPSPISIRHAPVWLPWYIQYLLHDQHSHLKAAGSATATTRIAPSTHPWLGHNVPTNVLALRCHFLPSIVRNFGTVSNWPDRAALLFWRVQSKTRRGNCSVPSRKSLLVINNSCFCSFLANRCRRTTNYHRHNYSNTE